jgi:hypothetical protein
MLFGAGIPFFKTSCIISFFPVILVNTCWIQAGITRKKKKRKTIQAPSLHSVEPCKLIGKQVLKIKKWLFRR